VSTVIDIFVTEILSDFRSTIIKRLACREFVTRREDMRAYNDSVGGTGRPSFTRREIRSVALTKGPGLLAYCLNSGGVSSWGCPEVFSVQQDINT